MVAEASITGLFKTLLIIIGAMVVLRFIGQLMIAKRNLEEEREQIKKQKREDERVRDTLRSMGKTKILSKNNSNKSTAFNHGSVEDVDFEELD